MNEMLRLLHVEDSESDAALIARLLEQAGYEVRAQRVDDPDAMAAALHGEEWDVILADHQMSQFNAPAALQLLRQSGRDIPFLILSGSIGEELVVDMLRSGACDYVNKNNLARLLPAVAREIREARARQEQRRTERELRDSQERLALAIEATQLGWFDWDPKTNKGVWSELTRRQFGLLAGTEITDRVFHSAVHPDDIDRIKKLIAQAMCAEESGRYVAEYRTIGIEDHIERWISACGRFYFDAEGNPTRFIGVSQDVSERKKLEEQYRQAQKLETVGRLAGGIAHDFNNLLTVINGHSDLVLEQIDEMDPLCFSIGEIRKAGSRAAELTRQLLAFSRKQVVERKSVDLNSLISGSRGMIARLVGEDIVLVTETAPDLGYIFADNGQLHQVIMNLVVNARDAMPGGGTLTIETRNSEGRPELPMARQKGFVLLTVTDTGVGMDEEVRRHVFDPFFTTKEEGVGTGLGLSTVYGIVEQYGGWIEVASEPGKGAKFVIGFPRSTQSPAEVAAGPTLKARKTSETVLVVEDQEEVRKLAALVLSAEGYQLLEAKDAEDAMNVVENHAAPIELMLTDVVMPGMNGKELAERLKPRRPKMRVLYMSGYSDNVISNACTAEGRVDYIAKPFTPHALAAKVHSMLREARA